MTLATWVLTGVVLVGGLVFDLVTSRPTAPPPAPAVIVRPVDLAPPLPTDDTYAIPSSDPELTPTTDPR